MGRHKFVVACCFPGGSFVGVMVFIVGEDGGPFKWLKQGKNWIELYAVSLEGIRSVHAVRLLLAASTRSLLFVNSLVGFFVFMDGAARYEWVIRLYCNCKIYVAMYLFLGWCYMALHSSLSCLQPWSSCAYTKKICSLSINLLAENLCTDYWTASFRCVPVINLNGLFLGYPW
jgi:hypothetical protein